MSYFAHAYPKSFVGTKATQAASPTVAGVNNGLLIDAGVHSVHLKNQAAPYALGLGTYGFFSPSTNLSVIATSAEVTQGQALELRAASVFPNDKIGQFHGGYAESSKSKLINPKFVSDFYKVVDAVPEQAIVHVGNTNFQDAFTLTFVGPCGAGYTPGTYTNVPTTTSGAGTGLTVNVEVNVAGEIVSIVENQVGSGYVALDTITPDPTTLGHDGVGLECTTTVVAEVGEQACEFEFLCGETYNLFINLYGSPVLRVLDHDSYRVLAAYTGCCPDDAIEPVAVNSTLVFIDWAKQIIESPYLKDFIRPVVFDEQGNPWFATAEEAVAELWPATQIWDNYDTSIAPTPGALGGLRLIGAYTDTEFGNCSFQCTDFYNKEVVKMIVQLRDETGDPCAFDGLCVVQECCGFGGEGFGETYLRELIMSDSYLQNRFSTDQRIREVIQSNEFFNAIDRTQFYTKYVIQHNVPRNYNDTGIHNADQYNLCIYVPAGVTATDLEGFMDRWLTAAGNPLGAAINTNGVKTFSHTACRPVALPTP
jgi:hypothetical protein